MGSIDPSLISDPEEQKWVYEISKIISQLEINSATPSVSLFQVPKTITATKPEAYKPQQIGLGPIHHFQPLPYKKMEQKKLAVVRKFLLNNPILSHVFETVKKVVPVVRSCYDMFLQGGDEHLALIFTIDGVFLPNLFIAYNNYINIARQRYQHEVNKKAEELMESDRDSITSLTGTVTPKWLWTQPVTNEETTRTDVIVTVDDKMVWKKTFSFPTFRPELPKVGPQKRLVAQDIMMVENQIPYMVLDEIHKAYVSFAVSSSYSTYEHLTPSIFRIFCMVHSPLKLCSEPQAPSSADHLLHYMYQSILNNVPIPVPEPEQNYGRSQIEAAFELVTSLPTDEIVQVYEQTISILETFCETNTIIPSASELHDKGGFLFQSMKDDHGIQNIGISGKDIYLPVITLNTDSDVVLRNLIAYETLTAANFSDSNGFPLAEYMVLMCALVVKADDVKKLENVIKGDLSADEVVKLFTEMSSSIPSMKMEDFKLKGMMDEINKGYYSMWRMKPYLALKKLAGWLLVFLKAVGGFVGSSWKIVAFIVGLCTVYLLVKKAYCDAYGCK